MEILGLDGKAIKLTEREMLIANHNQRHCNALGYDIPITTLTTIIKKITEQKFFQLAPADYVPVRVGEGAWSSSLLTYRSFDLAADFATGVLNTGANSARLAQADAGIDAIPVAVKNWAKENGWTLFDLQQAAKSGNWDLVTEKERARKKNWDLGIQQVAFLGLSGSSDVLGLYTQSGVENNTTLITEPISNLVDVPADVSAVVKGLLQAYRLNCQRTAWPTHFIMPENDYLGMATPSSPSFPIKSLLELFLETFQVMTGNKNFKILPCAYGDTANNSLGVTRYALLNYDDASIRMDIPVDYTNTLANSINNFSFQNVGYGQFTGVMAYRPLELMYFSY